MVQVKPVFAMNFRMTWVGCEIISWPMHNHKYKLAAQPLGMLPQRTRPVFRCNQLDWRSCMINQDMLVAQWSSYNVTGPLGWTERKIIIFNSKIKCCKKCWKICNEGLQSWSNLIFQALILKIRRMSVHLQHVGTKARRINKIQWLRSWTWLYFLNSWSHFIYNKQLETIIHLVKRSCSQKWYKTRSQFIW